MIFTVDENFAGTRLDKYLSEVTEFSRSFIAKLIDGGQVLVGGNPAKASLKLNVGDIINLEVPEAAPAEALPENIPLDIVYEDEYILVADKPAGMLSTPGLVGGRSVQEWLTQHCGKEIFVAHRLDMSTSGLLVAAKSKEILKTLQNEVIENPTKNTKARLLNLITK